MKPDELERRLLYRDAMMLIIDKPAGLPVHAGPRGGAHLEMYLDALRFGLGAPPALAHRLDRDTSGCLVLGRHRKALRRLGALFAEGAVKKTYWAVVVGGPPTPTGRIDEPLRKLERRTGWRMVIDPAGQPAATEWHVVAAAGDLTWLALSPLTGRTHQIRVHCAALGCPILGDVVYGASPGATTAALHLHARAISVPLYPRRTAVAATAPVPAHLAASFATLGHREPDAERADQPSALLMR
ncbi:MAG: RNA pseudouridine synthase [Alphaproteobacteria bacterium]|nr:RNA pseudouridine synthase [Alphaproteobacteria bacterium]